MKRLSFSLLATILLLSLSGCGNTNNSAAKSDTSAAPTETEAAQSENTAQEESAAPEQAVEVQVKEIAGSVYTVPVVDITAIVDSVEVQDVIGNRGNCKMPTFDQSEFPKNLHFGEKRTVRFANGCNLIEIEVVTDKGSFTFNVSQ